MPSLRSQLEVLTTSLADQIMAALKNASLHELVGAKGGGALRSNGRRERLAGRGGGGQPVPIATTSRRTGKNGRLPRRSPEEIAKTLNKIVLLVKTHKDGMRAEEIRSALGMQAKEMPRVLKEGLSMKKS